MPHCHALADEGSRAFPHIDQASPAFPVNVGAPKCKISAKTR